MDPLLLQGTQFPTDANGNIICSDVSSPGASSAGGFLGPLLIFAVVWALVPLVIAAALASSRGESVGTAIVLTLLLGWIGLAIVAFGQGRSRRAAAEVLDGERRPPDSNRAEALADRFRRLDELRDAGVITADEHASRRQELLQTT